MAGGKAYIVPSNEEPTFFNREMALGTYIFPVVGTIIGGFIGKSRMESEQATGILVKPPSRMNITALNGFLYGSMVSAFVSMAVLTIGGPAAVLGAIGILIGGTALAAFAGGSYQKDKMDALYEQGRRNEMNEKTGIVPLKQRLPQIGLGQQLAPGEPESTKFRDMVGAGQGRGKGF